MERIKKLHINGFRVCIYKGNVGYLVDVEKGPKMLGCDNRDCYNWSKCYDYDYDPSDEEIEKMIKDFKDDMINKLQYEIDYLNSKE